MLCYYFFLGLHSAYEWKHVIFVFLSFISLNMMISSSIHFPENDVISFILMVE
jgi:hypothetical protein